MGQDINRWINVDFIGYGRLWCCGEIGRIFPKKEITNWNCFKKYSNSENIFYICKTKINKNEKKQSKDRWRNNAPTTTKKKVGNEKSIDKSD